MIKEAHANQLNEVLKFAVTFAVNLLFISRNFTNSSCSGFCLSDILFSRDLGIMKFNEVLKFACNLF